MSTLLKVVKSASKFNDDLIQRIAMYLLDALSSEVDCSDKQIVGSLGAFPVIKIFIYLFIIRIVKCLWCCHHGLWPL